MIRLIAGILLVACISGPAAAQFHPDAPNKRKILTKSFSRLTVHGVGFKTTKPQFRALCAKRGGTLTTMRTLLSCATRESTVSATYYGRSMPCGTSEMWNGNQVSMTGANSAVGLFIALVQRFMKAFTAPTYRGTDDVGLITRWIYPHSFGLQVSMVRSGPHELVSASQWVGAKCALPE